MLTVVFLVWFWVFLFCFALRIILTIAITTGLAEHSFSHQDFYFRTIFILRAVLHVQ